MFIEDINDDGVAVGGETTADGNMHAIRYTDLGGVQDLSGLPGFGAQSYASAIAPDGAIGGHADRADGTSVFFGHRYTAKGGRSEICTGSCSVWDLNGRGQVVGLLPGRDPTTWQAFFYTPEAGLRTLGTLGGARSSASGISEAGVVVGNAQLAGAAKEDLGHAFIYDSRDANARLRDLNAVVDASGWILQAANDVNESFIVGYGLRGDSSGALPHRHRQRQGSATSARSRVAATASAGASTSTATSSAGPKTPPTTTTPSCIRRAWAACAGWGT